MIGKTKDRGFQVGARRTFPVSVSAAWDMITSSEGIHIWLSGEIDGLSEAGQSVDLANGTVIRLRVYKPCSHLRLTWKPVQWDIPSTIQVRVIPNSNKTIIAFHQENLPGSLERAERKQFFKDALDALERLAIDKYT